MEIPGDKRKIGWRSNKNKTAMFRLCPGNPGDTGDKIAHSSPYLVLFEQYKIKEEDGIERGISNVKYLQYLQYLHCY